MTQVMSKRKPEDMHDSQMGWRDRPRRQRGVGGVSQLFQRIHVVAAPPKQKSDSPPPNGALAQPVHERRALHDAAEADPSCDVRENVVCFRRRQGKLHIGAAFAEADERDAPSRMRFNPIQNYPGVFFQCSKAFHGNHLGFTTQLTRDGQPPCTIGSGVTVGLVKGPRHNADQMGLNIIGRLCEVCAFQKFRILRDS
ncbi:MAG: hypothetical protein ACREKL_03690 [Chthoniobacterales bacterium]